MLEAYEINLIEHLLALFPVLFGPLEILLMLRSTKFF